MGKIFLLGIVAAMIYGAYGIWGHIDRITHPEPVPVQSNKTVARESEDRAEEIKTVPAASSAQKSEPLPVLASNHEWIQVEAWGIIGPGDELPDGTVLESWESRHAVVVTANGARERRRFRSFHEAMAKVVPGVAAVPMQGVEKKY